MMYNVIVITSVTEDQPSLKTAKKFYKVKEKNKMKRILAFSVAAMAALTLAACSDDKKDESSKKTDKPSSSAVTEPAVSAYDDAVAVLDTAWAAYPEADKFPVFGGSTDVAMEYDGKAGPFTLTMTEEMSSNLKVPESLAAQIKSAASMIHMMNANTFTSAVFEVNGDIEAFSTSLVDSVNNTHWMCGFPETVITVKVGSYLVMAFGNGEIIENFKNAVTTAVDGAVLVHEGPVSFGDGNGDISVGNGDGGDGIMVPVF